MTELIVVVGLTGVGKTSVIDQARQKTSYDLEVVSYGTKLLKTAQSLDLVESRDELTELPREKYNALQNETVLKVAEQAESTDADTLILDTHASLDTPSGYRPGLTLSDLKELQPTKLVHVWADPAEIQRRREEDGSRDRDAAQRDALDEQQEVSRQMAASFSVISRAPLSLIANHNRGLQEAGGALASLIEE